MELTKEQARAILQGYIDAQIIAFGEFKLPVTDEVVQRVSEGNNLTEYTWRYLLFIAYGESDCGKKQLSVKDLILKLKKMPQNAPVYSENREYFGEVNGVEIRNGFVNITEL